MLVPRSPQPTLVPLPPRPRVRGRVAIVTGSSGLIGSASVRRFCELGYRVVGIDNDLRGWFFGSDASTAFNRDRLIEQLPGFRHCTIDIRDDRAIDAVFAEYGTEVEVVIHCAAQPSHDWAARDPKTDFAVNATGTMVMLEAVRRHCPRAAFVFTSTNKVYGDTPNLLPLIEHATRFEIDESHEYYSHGIDERMSIDRTMHSLFGVSKLAADAMVQEYGRYFGMHTAVFRGGCLTGPGHAGTALHGFLAYLMQCTRDGTPYVVHGHLGKQVRDNIHCADLVECFVHFVNAPRCGEVYNLGGGRHSNCSMLEAIAMCEEIADRKLSWSYQEPARQGDHRWWISDVRRFRAHYPSWDYRHSLRDTLIRIHDELSLRARVPAAR